MDETVMHKKTITVALLASILLALTSCGDTGSSAKYFYYRLRGTWESNNTNDYSGALVITSDRITITGYDQTLWSSSHPTYASTSAAEMKI